MPRFKGHDWTELAEIWGLTGETDDELLEATRKYLLAPRGGPGEKEIAKDVRAYLRALYKQSEKNSYSATVWQGLLKIKRSPFGDESLLKFVYELLPCMWS